MEFKNGDIVRVIAINKECLVVESAFDLELERTRYFVYNENYVGFIVDEADMILVGNIEEELEAKFEEETKGIA